MQMISNSAIRSDAALYSLRLALDGAMKTAMKLASGDRIYSAAEDPAGLVISETLRDRIATLRQESRNVSMTLSKYESVSATALGLRDQLIELRSLALGAANDGTNSPEAQQAYTDAAKSIVKTYNQTIVSSEYNGRKTLDGSAGSLAKIEPLSGIDLSSASKSLDSLELIDSASAALDNALIDLGARQRNELRARQASVEIELQNLTAAESQIRDTDYAAEYSRYVAQMIRTYSSVAVLSHSFLSARTVLSLVS